VQGLASQGLAVGAGATITDTVNLNVQDTSRDAAGHVGGGMHVGDGVHAGAGGHVGGRSSARLTAREREVLGLVAAGISNKGIARALQVSPNTVKFHIAAILQKFDASSRAEAVVAALRRGDLTL
jgi:DNA-binding CsgD family transcriptional regulator